jgi:hypothetical protein
MMLLLAFGIFFELRKHSGQTKPSNAKKTSE